MKTSRAIIAMAYLTVGLVFVLDWSQGGAAEIEMLYLFPLTLITLWSSPKDASLVLALTMTCTLLSLAAGLAFTGRKVDCTVSIPRFLVIGGIWMTAALSVLRKKKERTTQWIGLSPVKS
jgi:hypothetical protein